MTELRSRPWLVLVLVGAGVLLVNGGVHAYRTLVAKAHSQQAVTDVMTRWEHGYAAAAKAVAGWDAAFAPSGQVRDVFTLLKVVDLPRYGLTAKNATANVTKIEGVSLNKIPLGITRACLATGNGEAASFDATAPDYAALLSGIERLAQRRDIEIGSVTLAGEEAVPAARLRHFCVLIREDKA